MFHLLQSYPVLTAKSCNPSWLTTSLYKCFSKTYPQHIPCIIFNALSYRSRTALIKVSKSDNLSCRGQLSFFPTLEIVFRRDNFKTPNSHFQQQRYFCTSELCLDFDSDMADNKYLVGYAKLGTSSCKKCKQKIDKGALRIAKLTTNPFSDEAGEMKQWFHPQCIFESFQRARATTKKIEEPDDVEGFSDLQQEDKDRILKLIKGNMTVVLLHKK